MTAVLTANSYFGLIPGLFPNTPHQFSYYSRTVNKIISCKHKENFRSSVNYETAYVKDNRARF